VCLDAPDPPNQTRGAAGQQAGGRARRRELIEEREPRPLAQNLQEALKNASCSGASRSPSDKHGEDTDATRPWSLDMAAQPFIG
jgi:hypothetical protein